MQRFKKISAKNSEAVKTSEKKIIRSIKKTKQAKRGSKNSTFMVKKVFRRKPFYH